AGRLDRDFILLSRPGRSGQLARRSAVSTSVVAVRHRRDGRCGRRGSSDCGDAVRALTLTQPWCGLVASGIKLVENRPRSMIGREDFGVSFALHASREIDAQTYERIAEIAPDLLQISRNIDGGCDHFYSGAWYRLSRITSAVIAVATVERVVDE